MSLRNAVDNSGMYFRVYIFDEFVVKVPKHKKVRSQKRLAEIAEMQTYLSQYIDGILPCYHIGNYLIMPKAPGKKGKDYGEDQWEYIKGKRDEILIQIREHGYELGDVGRKNAFYDKNADKVYIVDFHPIRKREEKK